MGPPASLDDLETIKISVPIGIGTLGVPTWGRPTCSWSLYRLCKSGTIADKAEARLWTGSFQV